MHGLVPAEPGELPLGIAAGGLPDLIGGGLHGLPSRQSVHKFLVANGLHGSGRLRDAGVQQPLNFLQKAHFQHLRHPQVNAVIELLPVFKIQPQPDRAEFRRDGLSTAVVLRNGLSGFQIDLQRS